MSTTSRRALSSVVATALIATAGGYTAAAQSSDASANSDEIVVTARRRSESLQDVPVAVSAFSGGELDDIGAQDLTDIGDMTPNVTLKTSRSTNTTLTAFIRGVGQQDPVSGFEAGVGVYIDDVYLNRPQAALLDIYDVERIEVLRGPQGTLYGRNTIGGAIKYVTRDLTDDPSARLKLTGGTYGQFDAVGTFNLPITSSGTLKLGGAVAYLSRNGFGDNLTNGLENYNKDVLGGRLSAEWAPSDNFSFKVSGDWTRDNSDPRQGHRLLDYPGFPVLGNVFDTRASLNTPVQHVVARGVSGVAELRANDNFTFKNIVAYRADRTETPIDFDSLPIADLDVPAIYDNDQFSEEFQILYDSERLHGIVGFYYLDANGLTQFDVVLQATADFLKATFPAIYGSIDTIDAFSSSDVNTKTWSIFGDWTYDLTDQLSLSFGGRYTSDERTISLQRFTYNTAGLSPVFGGPNRAPDAVAADLDASAKFTDFSPRASISFEPSDNHTFYFTYSQGFKGGSFDPRCAAASAPDLDGNGTPGEYADQVAFCKFLPEDLASFEAGWKNNLLDGRYRSNLAVFLSKYNDVQIPGSIGIDTNSDGISDTFAGVTTNAAKATIWGVEYEGNANVAEDMFGAGDTFDWQFSMGYTNAQYDEYFGRGSPPPDLSNVAVFQNTPRWNAYNRFTYTAPMHLFGSDGSTSLYASAAYKSLTHQFGYVGPLDQPEYALIDAGLYWKSASGGLKLGVYGTNLTNQEYKVAGYDFVTSLPAFGNSALGLTGVLTAFYGNPRQVFGTIEVAF